LLQGVYLGGIHPTKLLAMIFRLFLFIGNQRVLRAEDEIAGINCDVGEFLSQMSSDEPVIICVKASASMKRHEQHLGGQLWMQSDRHMTATNIRLDGMSNDATSVTLAAVAKAVEWQHAMGSATSKRPAPRVVIYPPSLIHLQSVLETGDLSLDGENGHEHGCQKILLACGKDAECPRFFPSDSQEFGGLDIADSVPRWIHMAAQVSVGGRKQVLEDGADVCNSESDSDREDRGDELTKMYVDMELDSQSQPVSQSHRLPPEVAAALRARACKTPELCPPPLVEIKATPLNSDDETHPVSYDQERALEKTKKIVRQPLEKSSQASRRRRAELEACDRQSVQAKRRPVWHMATLPKPES
jgi:hypothetical protein